MKRRITDDMFARIPALVLAGMTKAEIAAMCGVTPGTLAVQCCRRSISLRKGGPRPRRTKLGLQLPLSDGVLTSLREAARAMGRDTARLASDLLEKIASDNLYKAVLDEEAHCAPSTIRPAAAASSAINRTLAVREPAH